VPSSALARLQSSPQVATVTPNRPVTFQTFNGDFDPERDYGSLFRAARVIDADRAWDHGLTGQGVDVALLDSGVAPVRGLDAAGKVVNAVDLSPEGAHPEVAYLDGYGHGTHMAGIIAGRDPEVVAGKERDDKRSFVGVAPDARIVNVKAADASGTSQAAAVVSGAAALLLQQRPTLTPDQLKELLVSTARPLKHATQTEEGAGLLAVEPARAAKTPTAATQTWPAATGTGSLELARGTAHITDPDGAALTGEQDAFGQAWDGRMWSGRMWSGDSWTGRTWSGRMWSGDTWSGQVWSGNAWSSAQWGGDQDPLVPSSDLTSP
jgi:subtilisin family serine protease